LLSYENQSKPEKVFSNGELKKGFFYYQQRLYTAYFAG